VDMPCKCLGVGISIQKRELRDSYMEKIIIKAIWLSGFNSSGEREV
jgi:hypothetical protein